MDKSAEFLYSRIRLISRLAVACAIGAAFIFRGLFSDTSLTWQLVLAFVALAIGIPHGAVDHLISIPQGSRKKFFLFISLYLLIAVVSLLLILTWNLLGFEIVVWMSAFHFGIGDLTYIGESDRLAGRSIMPKYLQPLYLISIGTIPVVIPLVQSKSQSALESINPHLVNWAGAYSHQLKIAIIAIAGLTCLLLVASKRLNELLDLALLSGLVFLTPPLVAFAFYFGCWHALRHTARLTLLLPRAQLALESGSAKRALQAVVIPGIPALIGAVILSVVIYLMSSASNNESVLWSLLALVWALTVPHMIATFRFDLRSLRSN